MKETIRVVVIGCGYWGKNYVRLLTQLPRSKLVAICDQSQKHLREAGKFAPGAKKYRELEELFAHVSNFDAAIVATNPGSHYAITRRLLEMDKHVLVEKPITTSSAEADELVIMARNKNLILMVGHIFLFNSGIEEIKGYIDSGMLGKIYYLYARRTNLGPVRQDVNAAWDLAPHDIAKINHLLGNVPEWVSAVGANFLREGKVDASFIVLGYPDGKLGNIHVSWADPHKVREVVVIGSEQRVVFNDTVPQQKVTIYKKGIAASSLPYLSYADYQQIALRDGDIISPCLNIKEPLRNQVTHFLECIQDGHHPLSDGVNGLQVVKILEAVDTSMRLQGAPVKINWTPYQMNTNGRTEITLQKTYAESR